MSHTRDIAGFIAGHRKESLPAEVIAQAKLLVLDTLGCAIGGHCTDLGRQVVCMARRYRAPAEATLMGDGTRVCSEFASWANSSLANILDMDDVFAGVAHQGNCLVPVAFALGEATRASGLEVLHAIVLGFEVGSRIGLYAWPSPGKSRTYFPSTWQVFNAVTAAGKLLGLDEDRLVHAFGLAGTVPPVPLDMQKFVERPMGFAKNVFGWTSFTGAFWTSMAASGVKGTPDILDGDAGFWAMMGSDAHDPQELTRGLGEHYHLLDTKFKPYPLCTWGHTSMDAVTRILDRNHLGAEDIAAVKVSTVRRAVDYLSNPGISTLFDAQFSLPHAVSMAALGKRAGPEWMSEENILRNPRARALAAKVSMQADPEAEQTFFAQKGLAIPSRVELSTADGRVFREEVHYSKGTPRNPFTQAELEDKFRNLTATALAPQKAERLIELIDGMDRLPEVCELAQSCGP